MQPEVPEEFVEAKSEDAETFRETLSRQDIGYVLIKKFAERKQ